ncbi:MAG TPA: enoyl-CoA hydratase-related protein [Acidimicrobiia bacterium]|nr:enoyl-CoA hydratase-related protein [Acidimicrobiia bacterium]
MTEPLVLVADHGAVRVVTLNRVDSANAFNRALYDAVAGALDEAADDDDVSVVVITGAGRVFSAGADVKVMARGAAGDEADASSDAPSDAQAPADPSDSLAAGFDAFLPALSTFPKPLLAAVNGAAVGIGVTMLLHCDIVLLSDRARLRMSFTTMGAVPEAGSTVLLPRLVGRQRSAELLFTSEWVDAARAVEIGLALAVHPADALLSEALDLATRIAAQPLSSLVATKQLLLEAERDPVDAAIVRELAALGGVLRLPGARGRVLDQIAKPEHEPSTEP